MPPNHQKYQWRQDVSENIPNIPKYPEYPEYPEYDKSQWRQDVRKDSCPKTFRNPLSREAPSLVGAGADCAGPRSRRVTVRWRAPCWQLAVSATVTVSMVVLLLCCCVVVCCGVLCVVCSVLCCVLCCVI